MGSVVKFNHSSKKEKETAEAETRQLSDLEGMVSVFEKRIKRSRKRLKKRNQTLSDSAGNVAVLQSLLDMMLAILPTAEKIYRKFKNERAAYAVVALVTQVREISADIQRYSSSNKNASVVLEKIVMPSLQLILQNYLNSNAILVQGLQGQKNITSRMVRRLINESNSRFGDFLKEVTNSITDKTQQYFGDK